MATSYQDDYMKTALRLPRELHARIQEAATKSGKSLNSELIARLEDSFVSGPDWAMLVAETQYQAAMQAVEREEVGAKFTALAAMVDLISMRAGAPLAKLLKAEELEDLQRLIVMASEERDRKADFDKVLEMAKKTRDHVTEARQRFLKAKGAKGVREAKV